MFNPRFTKPEKNNYFYNKPQNKAIYGKPTQDGLNVLSNCVGYVNGRFNEIIGEFKYQLVSNAGSFIKYYCNEKTGLTYSDKPDLAGIMVWKHKNGGAGHVAIVEEVSIDKSVIITSESAYGGTAFYTTKRTNKNGRWGMNSNYEYIGCIINPYVRSVSNIPDDESKKIIEYTIQKGDTLIKIANKYGVLWQDIYMYNKKIIDERANRHGHYERCYDWIYPDTKIKICIEK